MASNERSGFFNATLVDDEYDRVYDASDFASYFASFISNGVFAGKLNDLAVLPAMSPDMSVRVMPGKAWINGYWYENSQASGNSTVFSVPVASSTLDRYDAVVVRLDLSSRTMKLAFVRGESSSNPSKYKPVRAGGVYELVIAYIYVKKNTSAITASNIIDTRTNKSICGYVTGTVNSIDTTTIFNQLQAATSDAVSQMNAALDGTTLGSISLKAGLDRSAAKELQSGTDLNSIVLAGTYFSVSTSSANSLKNKPAGITFGAPIYLYVLKHGDLQLQTIICLKDGARWSRYGGPGNSAWGNWVQNYDSKSVLPVGNGGTGAVTPSAALSNLGIRDYIIAEGRSGFWKYVKYSGGIAMLCGRYEDPSSYSVSSPWGSIYSAYNSLGPYAYPFSFTSVPVEVGQFTNGISAGMITYTQAANTKSESAQYYFARPTAYTLDKPAISIIVVGRWK